ncbi:MAG: hypothetical protein Q7S84_03910 [bacterium]|nr:hypothetical protein [bacterium]
MIFELIGGVVVFGALLVVGYASAINNVAARYSFAACVTASTLIGILLLFAFRFVFGNHWEADAAAGAIFVGFVIGDVVMAIRKRGLRMR